MKRKGYFCSKDCPDCCPFEVDNKLNFNYVDKLNITIPFVCKKLKRFYEREVLTGDYSFVLEAGIKVGKSFDDVCKEVASFLLENKNKNILYLRGSGSLGLFMGYYDLLFENFKNLYFVEGSLCDETGLSAHEDDFGCVVNPAHENLREVDIILLFGKNCKVVSPHLYAFLKQLKKNGKEIIYIDPIYTETAKIADKYIRINPGTDGILAASILDSLKYNGTLNTNRLFHYCGVSQIDFEYLLSLFCEKKVGIITGFGLQRYSNGKNIVNWINRLAVETSNERYLYFGRPSKINFEKPKADKKKKVKIYEIPNYLKKSFFDVFVIVAANPIITYPESGVWQQEFLNKKVVVVDTNFTETTKYADYFIKVGGMFAQPDAMGSYFFNIDNIRKEMIVDLPNDLDVVKNLAEHCKFSIDFKNIDEILLKEKIVKRVYKQRNIPIISPYVEKGKFRLLTLSNYFYLNSQLSEDYKKEKFVFINPKDADALKILDGETVTLKNECGYIHVKVKIDSKVCSGVIMTYKNRKLDNFIVNTLTKSIPTDSDNGVAIYDTFVEVCKNL
ncbi:molybdopterin-dependent oxidoreductase [Deferribacter abyssi]|uniref:molybdopterin-dependent oxidoreductase n=1 Tax=Deferribacter abyssi TaxID=213806 RepID=UPI003C1B4F9B